VYGITIQGDTLGCRPSGRIYISPYTVVRIIDPCNVAIQKGARARVMIVHRDKLRPCDKSVDEITDNQRRTQRDAVVEPINSEPEAVVTGRPQRKLRRPSRYVNCVNINQNLVNVEAITERVAESSVANVPGMWTEILVLE